jgi:hypothetical protein
MPCTHAEVDVFEAGPIAFVERAKRFEEFAANEECGAGDREKIARDVRVGVPLIEVVIHMPPVAGADARAPGVLDRTVAEEQARADHADRGVVHRGDHHLERPLPCEAIIVEKEEVWGGG